MHKWAALNADERVREFFPSVLTFEEGAAQMQEARAHIAEYGFGSWAVEVVGGPRFIGLAVVPPGQPFTGVELGYRLAVDAWGRCDPQKFCPREFWPNSWAW